MTSTREPDFMEWVLTTDKGWELKPNAPAEVKRAFDAYMKSISMKIETE